MRHLTIKTAVVSVFVLAAAISAPAVHAALSSTSTLSQIISNGTASTDIRDATNTVIATPTITMASAILSTTQQTSTGSFGSNTQRIYVDNPGGANNGWSLTLNATTPGTGAWTSGGNNYAYNGTAASGQLTVNPAAATVTANTGGNTGVTLGSSTTFSGSSAVTLVNAAAASADIWNGYFTGVGLSQTIPANQPAGTYTLSMTQTLTVL